MSIIRATSVIRGACSVWWSPLQVSAAHRRSALQHSPLSSNDSLWSTPSARLSRRFWKLSTSPASQYDNCSCGEAYELSTTKGSHKYLDVRSPAEFAAGHPCGAVNIPVMFQGALGMTPNPEFIEQVKAAFPDKGEALVVGCQSGKRSTMAVEALSGAGYTKLTNVEGGFAAWSGAGLPVEK